MRLGLQFLLVVRTRETLRRMVDVGLRPPLMEREALRWAARRHRGIALVWHRIGRDGPQPHEAVRTVATATFAAQLDLLGELGDIVPLADLEHPGEGGRPRFALTFDDDDAGHVADVMPELRARGLTATFFLSGRWCHGYGPYWWELLEEDIRHRGTEDVATWYGLDVSLAARDLVKALTGTVTAGALAEKARRGGRPPMNHDEAIILVEAGMEIGFHTIDHDALPALGERELPEVVVRGCQELAHDLGVRLLRFAYPHGLTDERVERAVGLAGYASAWTTAKHVVAPGAPLLALGRWDIGHLPLSRARRALVQGLARPYR